MKAPTNREYLKQHAFSVVVASLPFAAAIHSSLEIAALIFTWLALILGAVSGLVVAYAGMVVCLLVAELGTEELEREAAAGVDERTAALYKLTEKATNVSVHRFVSLALTIYWLYAMLWAGWNVTAGFYIFLTIALYAIFILIGYFKDKAQKEFEANEPLREGYGYRDE